MATYKVQRFFFRTSRKVTLATGLTLDEARAMCSSDNPGTCSSTATSAAARRRTKRSGPWFHGFTKE